MLQPCSAARVACSHPPHAGGAPFDVCDRCAENTTATNVAGIGPTRQDDFAWPTLPRFSQVVPLLGPMPRRHGFQTLLCHICTKREMTLLQARLLRLAPAHLVPTAAERAFMQDYPWRTCTCLRKLLAYDQAYQHLQYPQPAIAGYRHCEPHRQAVWADMANTALRNEAWLESIDRKDHLGVTARAGVLTKRQRDRDGTFRACRCGVTIDTNLVLGVPNFMFPFPGPGPAAQPRVTMCMACEGVHIRQGLPRQRALRAAKNNYPIALGRTIVNRVA